MSFGQSNTSKQDHIELLHHLEVSTSHQSSFHSLGKDVLAPAAILIIVESRSLIVVVESR